MPANRSSIDLQEYIEIDQLIEEIKMSRTHRNFPNSRRMYRKPKTTNEIKQNAQLEADIKVDDGISVNISKHNRRHRFIPTAWDDIPFSWRQNHKSF